jgi:hypothetical protein
MQQVGTIRWGSAASFDVGQSAGAAAMELIAGNLGLGTGRLPHERAESLGANTDGFVPFSRDPGLAKTWV